MSNQVQGLVMEIEKRYCIIMTQEGNFHKVLKPSHPIILGQEITCSLVPKNNWLKTGLLAAGLLFMMLGGFLYTWTLPIAVAYVSLDINPSVEIGVNKDGLVIETKGLNDDGNLLLHTVSLEGKNIYTALTELIAAAIQNNYLTSEKENLIFSAVTTDPASDLVVINEELVYTTIVNSIKPINAPVEVLVTGTSLKVQKEARKQGISTGKYLLYLDTVQADQQTPVRKPDLDKKSLKDLGVKQWQKNHPSAVNPNLDKKDEQRPNVTRVLNDDHPNKANNKELDPPKNKNREKDRNHEDDKDHEKDKDKNADKNNQPNSNAPEKPDKNPHMRGVNKS